MAGSITVSSITLDSDNNFSIRSNTGATILSANGTGLITGVANSSITGDKIAPGQITGNLLTANCVSGNNIVSGLALTGNVSVTGNVKVGSTIGVGGATPSTSGAGITFPATQSASTDANTLDDYEEGTWSPTVFIGATEVTSYHFQNGSYTRVGRIVHANCWVRVNAKGAASGGVSIRNLPFVVAGGNASYTAGTIGYQDEMLSSSAPMYCYASINSSTVNLLYATATGGVDVTQANLNNGQFMMQVSYQTTA